MPKKYRKKPVVIEAFIFGVDGWPDWFHDKHIANEIITYSNDPDEGPFSQSTNVHCEIETLEGTMRGYYGDYIIKGIQGEVYPCKPDIFEATYESVEGNALSNASNTVNFGKAEVDINKIIEEFSEKLKKELSKSL